MAFMSAYIEPVSGFWVMTDDGFTELYRDDEEICPNCGENWSVSMDGEQCSNCGAEVEDEFEGFVGGLSASGYMDQSDPVYGETKAEVAQEMLDMYFDQPEDEMDEDELADMEWLEGIAAGNE